MSVISKALLKMELWNFNITPYTEEEKILLSDLTKMPPVYRNTKKSTKDINSKVNSTKTLDPQELKQAAISTQQILNEHRGTVIFVEEAYTLPSEQDMYSKEYLENLNHYIETSRF